MEVSSGRNAAVRVLGLGNDLLADDAFGIRVACGLRSRFNAAAEVITSSSAGFHLLDDILGATRLLVVDTIQTGQAPPGTIGILTEDRVRLLPGGSPHFVGLFDVLGVARKLGLAAPSEVAIIAVEAADCLTVGGRMHPAVEAAIGPAVDLGVVWVTQGHFG
jgi:hydrogenase maturation protease